MKQLFLNLVGLTLIFLTMTSFSISHSSITGKWVVQSFTGEKVDELRKEAYIEFNEEGRFHANLGCNIMNGEYEVKGDKLIFEKAMQTMMYCEGQMFAEQFLGSIVDKETTFVIDKNTLAIIDGGKELVLVKTME